MKTRNNGSTNEYGGVTPGEIAEFMFQSSKEILPTVRREVEN